MDEIQISVPRESVEGLIALLEQLKQAASGAVAANDAAKMPPAPEDSLGNYDDVVAQLEGGPLR